MCWEGDNQRLSVFGDINLIFKITPKCGSRGGEGGGGGGQGVRTPPGKSQVIWVSIGNKQLDPRWKKLDPNSKMAAN